MPRTYIVQSWLDAAAEYDEGDTYNGNQVGARSQKSVEVKLERSGDQWRAAVGPQSVADKHFNADGTACISSYADKPPTPRPKRVAKPIPIRHKISPAQRTLDRLDEQEAELHKEYKAGGLTEEEFFELQSILDLKRQKACKTLQKMQDEIDKAFPKYSGEEYNKEENVDKTEQKPCVEEKKERECKQQPKQETFWEALQKLTMYSLIVLVIGFILF